MVRKAVVRLLLPYIINILVVIFIVTAGMMYVFSSIEGKTQAHLGGGGLPADICWIIALVDALVLVAGIVLMTGQIRRYFLPVQGVICQMERADSEKNKSYKCYMGELMGSLEDYKACRFQLEQMKSVVQLDFISKLLNAGYKSKNQLLAEAENVGLQLCGCRYLVAVAGIFNNMDDEDVDVATIYESGIVLDRLKLEVEKFKECQNIWSRKTNYRRMVIVLQIQDELVEGASGGESFAGEKRFQERLLGLREDFKQQYGVDIFWGVSRLCDDPLYLWKCRDEANIAIGCCGAGRAFVIYSTELENNRKCYLPGVTRTNLLSFIRSGNLDEMRKVISLLKDENCQKRQLSRGQFVALNGMVIRMLEKVQLQDGLLIEGMIDSLNSFVLLDRGSHEEYFELLEACCTKLCDMCREEKHDKRGRLAEEIKAYIDENYKDSSLSLTRIGAEFNISDSYVSVIFKDYFGVNFSAYVEEIRIRRACMLLEESDMTVREVAEQTGYANEQSFRRAFKKVKGVSPKEIREE